MAKKATKKAETSNVVALPVPVLTKPVGVSAGKGSPKAELRGHEKAIDRIIEIRQQQENLKAEEAQVRAPVQAAAQQSRKNLEALTGKTIKSVQVFGTDQNARFTWKNAFRPTDIAHEPALRECLGPHYDGLFEASFDVKLRSKSPAEIRAAVFALKEALGDKFEALFEARPQIVAKPELLEKRTILKDVLTQEQNTALDLVLEQIQSQPMLSVK